MEQDTMAADSIIEGQITASEDSTVELHHGRIEHSRQQRQGIARRLGVAGLDPAVGCADWLSISWLRRTASQLAGRQLKARTVDQGVDSRIQHPGTLNLMK